MKNTYKKLFTVLLTSIYFFSAVAPTFAAAQYLYDANGNMTSNGQNCYEYNDYNQLKKVKTCSDNKLIAEYGYNSEGQRQIKKEYDTNGNLKWTITSISDKFEVKEYPDGREEITKYYFVNDQLIAKKNPDGTKEYVHNDHLGSTNIITDQQGQKVEETQYDPWGEVKAGGTKSKFQYTGQEKDQETGLNYYNARYYNSHTKHFTQPDDIVQDPYDPQTLNRYSYVKNNPLRYTDPSGHVAWLALAPLIAYFLVEVAPPMLEMTPAEMETLAMMSGTSNSSANKQNQMPMILPLPMAVAGSTIAVEEAGALKLAGEKPNTSIPIKSGSSGGPGAGKSYIPVDVKKQVKLENPKNICVFCRQESPKPQLDHAIPRSKGGDTTIKNIQVACPHCNQSKGVGQYPKSPPKSFFGLFPPSWWKK